MEFDAQGRQKYIIYRLSPTDGGALMKFPVILQPGEDGFIVAECPALPGCMTQGRNEKEALKNIVEAISLWLEVEAEKHAGQLPHGAVRRIVAA